VAYTHLETLAEAGLVERGRLTGRRGRPARTYRALGAAEFSDPPRQHRLLAILLATAVAEVGGRAPAMARRLGVAYGVELGAVDALGADLDFDGERIRAGNCVFGEACAASPELVCGLHAGILEGALGQPVEPLGPDGRGGCLFVMTTLGGA
jgi:predicted ArsR family transcriptional regulator